MVKYKTLKQQLARMSPTTECHVQFDDLSWIRSSVYNLRQDKQIKQHKDDLVTGTNRQHVAGKYYVELFTRKPREEELE